MIKRDSLDMLSIQSLEGYKLILSRSRSLPTPGHSCVNQSKNKYGDEDELEKQVQPAENDNYNKSATILVGRLVCDSGCIHRERDQKGPDGSNQVSLL